MATNPMVAHIIPDSLNPALLNPNAKALIFDLDGTLIDSLEINWKAMDLALRDQGIVIDRSEFISMTGRSLEEIVDIIVDRHANPANSIDRQEIVRQKRLYANSQADVVQPIDVVADVARLCHGRIPMAVGTGSDKHRALMMLASTGLLPLFNFVVAADDVTHHKPHPETFLRCAELMGVPPSLCQVFEDGDTGIQAAHDAGMMVTDVRPFIQLVVDNAQNANNEDCPHL